MQRIKLLCVATKWWSWERLVTVVRQRLVVETWYSGKEPSYVSRWEQSQEKCELLLYPPDLCEGREGLRLYEALKPCRRLAVVATVSEAAITEGCCVVLVTDGGKEFVSGCSCKEGLPQPRGTA